MGFESVLQEYFARVIIETDFIEKTYSALRRFGFTGENTIAAVCVCRDEIAQSARSIIARIWGEAFDLSSLAGMCFGGRTALLAVMHHAPGGAGRERYVYYALSHIAIHGKGRVGICARKGIEESTACGALHAFQKELGERDKGEARGVPLFAALDPDDMEYSLMRARLLREIPCGHVPDLLELTRISQRVIRADFEHALSKIVDAQRSDHALLTGIQIHGPADNYIWPGECYAMVDGHKLGIEVT
jgi:hypothetical protein